LDLEDVCRRGCEELFVVFNSGKTCKSNSNNQRECMDIKYSIGIGSVVKPTGLTMYSPGCNKDKGCETSKSQRNFLKKYIALPVNTLFLHVSS
jgi:hypothetical protein